MVSSWISEKARKGIRSGIAGRGLFAIEPIRAGAIVAVKGGQIVATRQLRELPEPLPNSEIQIADQRTSADCQQLNAIPTPSGGGTDRRQPNCSIPAVLKRTADWWA
jgi:hypothetical protein